jgi:hypothetical protein
VFLPIISFRTRTIEIVNAKPQTGDPKSESLGALLCGAKGEYKAKKLLTPPTPPPGFYENKQLSRKTI